METDYQEGWGRGTGWPHTHVCRLRIIRKGISSAEVPREERELPPPPRAPGPRVPVQGRGISTSGWENQQGLCPGETEGCWKPRCPLEGPCTVSLAHRYPTLHCRASSLNGARGVQGEAERQRCCSWAEPSPLSPQAQRLQTFLPLAPSGDSLRPHPKLSRDLLRAAPLTGAAGCPDNSQRSERPGKAANGQTTPWAAC